MISARRHSLSGKEADITGRNMKIIEEIDRKTGNVRDNGVVGLNGYDSKRNNQSLQDTLMDR